MILTLEEVKEYLKIDYDDEDNLLLELISTAENYLYNATGTHFDSSNRLAKLYCRVLVNEWYKDRGLTGNSKVRYTLQSILTQLKYDGDLDG